jgi:hypothetical protein
MSSNPDAFLSVSEAIKDKLEASFPAWKLDMTHFPEERRFGKRETAHWSASVRQSNVIASVTVTWTRNNHNKPIVRVRWGMKPGTFVTRESKAAMLVVAEEMSHNAPLVESMMRKEAALMGEPMEILMKMAKHSNNPA